MQTVHITVPPTNKLELAVGILWILGMLAYAAGFLPGLRRRERELERRVKISRGRLVPISRLRRLAAVLMMGMLGAVALAGAYHRDLGTLLGIRPTVVFCVTFFFLPAAVLLLGALDRRRMRAWQKPGA